MKFLKSIVMIIAALSIAACTGSTATAEVEEELPTTSILRKLADLIMSRRQNFVDNTASIAPASGQCLGRIEDKRYVAFFHAELEKILKVFEVTSPKLLLKAWVDLGVIDGKDGRYWKQIRIQGRQINAVCFHWNKLYPLDQEEATDTGKVVALAKVDTSVSHAKGRVLEVYDSVRDGESVTVARLEGHPLFYVDKAATEALSKVQQGKDSPDRVQVYYRMQLTGKPCDMIAPKKGEEFKLGETGDRMRETIEKIMSAEFQRHTQVKVDEAGNRRRIAIDPNRPVRTHFSEAAAKILGAWSHDQIMSMPLESIKNPWVREEIRQVRDQAAYDHDKPQRLKAEMARATAVRRQLNAAYLQQVEDITSITVTANAPSPEIQKMYRDRRPAFMPEPTGTVPSERKVQSLEKKLDRLDDMDLAHMSLTEALDSLQERRDVKEQLENISTAQATAPKKHRTL